MALVMLTHETQGSQARTKTPSPSSPSRPSPASSASSPPLAAERKTSIPPSCPQFGAWPTSCYLNSLPKASPAYRQRGVARCHARHLRQELRPHAALGGAQRGGAGGAGSALRRAEAQQLGRGTRGLATEALDG